MTDIRYDTYIDTFNETIVLDYMPRANALGNSMSMVCEEGERDGTREEGKKGRKSRQRGSEGRREGKKDANGDIEKGSGSYTIGSVSMYTIFLERSEGKPIVS